MRKARITLAALTATLIVGACAGTMQTGDAQYRQKATAMLKSDFKAKGIAGLERLDEDRVQSTCNATGNAPAPDVANALQAEQLATVKLPADGNFMGDWKSGDKIAQNGRGFTWSDKQGPAGGGCYNCHQIAPTESSFGSIGPSLYQFGKIRGNGPEVQKYIYSKIYNAKAFNVCSAMPRFGYVGALDEQNIKDLVALLLDPQSPVNSK
jgi:sulfur-oxidizing protein SoxX